MRPIPALDEANRLARYIAACNPTAIRSLLSRLEEAERDAKRYRWLRTAGAWESETGLDILSEKPATFDEAVDDEMRAAMKEQSK